MRPLHRLLKRQMRRFLGDEEPIPKRWRNFLDAVNNAYWQSDDDRNLLERSLELSSQELIQANSELRAIFTAFPDQFFRLDDEGNILDYRTGNDSDLGLAPDGLPLRRIHDIPDEGVRVKFLEAVRRLQETGSMVSFEYSFGVGKRSQFFEARLVPLLENQIMGIIRDITERKLGEEALKDSEARFRDISHSMADWIWETDKQGRYTFASGRVREIMGYDPDELIGRSPLELMKEEESYLARKTLKKIASGKEPIVDFEHWSRTKEGKEVCLLTKGVPLLDEKGRLLGYRGVDKDMTDRKLEEEERRELENKLQQAQKMEAIGTLAGGVAHDLNNILSGLVSYPELLLLEMPEDSPLRKPVMTIQKSGQKAAAIVQDLLSLARRGVATMGVMNLNDVIREYLKSPEHESLRFYHTGVQVQTDLDEDLLNILGSSIHLSKTVMNLVSNGAEAIRGEGKILISTENRYVDRPIRGYDRVAEGDYVVLAVSDSGIGISREDMERVFEPFYTKKTMGRSGTGLGMAVVWGTVKDHSGYIDIQSEEGKGTTILLYLPATREKPDERKAALSVQNYMGRGETILIVDDVKEQRKIASRMLTALGYSVATVSSGEEAVEYVKENAVDLAVLDMIMDPGMDGLETYKRILAVRPEQKAIIASGYSETDRVKEAQGLGAGAYIRKPYLLETIGSAVRHELDK